MYKNKKSSAKGRGDEVAKAGNDISPTVGHLKSLVHGRTFTLADFVLRDTVGEGSFGRVRLVKLKGSQDRSPFALKMMKKREIIRLKQVEHIKAEKEIMSRIDHNFIVNMFYAFQDEKSIFMLLEFVNGGELFSYLRQEGRLPCSAAKFYLAEIVLAFDYLHNMMIVYRDLKPENLLIDFAGHIKVTDFGFAKVVEDRTWTLCGTPEYLAPEIIQSKGHDKSVDWWAVGILTFEMLAGYPPFEDENPLKNYQKILGGRFEEPRHFEVKVKDIVRRLLALDPSKRLGCLKAGANDIKNHKWYKDVDWDLALNRGLAPPFVPRVKAADDTSMFEKYPESTGEFVPDLAFKDQRLFDDFI
jgi:protein kinase A/protein kinase X